MKKLLVISNHAPEKWSESQKEGWDSIEYIPFPNIPAESTSAEVIEQYAIPLCGKIGEFYGECDEKGAEGYVTIQGEFSLCKAIFDSLHGEVKFIFPTTERKVVEITNPDGSVTKTATFEFIRWREM